MSYEILGLSWVFGTDLWPGDPWRGRVHPGGEPRCSEAHDLICSLHLSLFPEISTGKHYSPFLGRPVLALGFLGFWFGGLALNCLACLHRAPCAALGAACLRRCHIRAPCPLVFLTAAPVQFIFCPSNPHRSLVVSIKRILDS